MGKFTALLFASLLVLAINALDAEARAANSTMSTNLVDSPASPFDWMGFLATLQNSRQAEAATLAPVMSSFLGVLATGKILPFITPLLVTYLVLPFLALVKSMAKGLLFLGVMGWLVSAFLPAFIGYMGLAAPGAFVARSIDASVFGPYLGFLSSFSVPNLAARGLQYLDMDNMECRMMMSCKAGEFMRQSYPSASRLLVSSGLINYLETPAMRADPFTKMALASLQGRAECDSQLPVCAGMRPLEVIMDPERSLNVTDVSNLFSNFTMPFTTTTTSTTPSPLSSTGAPSNSDIVVGALQRLAQNYYGYSLTT